MIKILADQNFNARILRGLRSRIPDLDAVTTEAVGLRESTDLDVIDWAANARRVILTHDARTFPHFACKRLAEGKSISGVMVVPGHLTIGSVVDELELLIRCSTLEDWIDTIKRLPL